MFLNNTMTHKFVLGAALVGAAVGVTGCFGAYRGDMTAATPESLHNKHTLKDLNAALAESPTRFKVSFIADAVVPGDDNWYQSNIVMHDYDIDRIPGGPMGFIEGRLEEVLKTARPTPERKNLRFVSMDVTDLDLKILEGNFFSGESGRYYARIEANVRISAIGGEVYLDQPITAQYEGIRQSFTGRQLKPAQDWHNMKQALLHATDALALKITQELSKENDEDPLNLKRNPKYDPDVHESPEAFAP